MESFGGPMNSFFFGETMSSECLEQAAMAASAGSTSAALELGFPQVSFLQMLNGPTKSEDEERQTEHEEEDEYEDEESKQLLRFQIQQRFHRESNFQRLLEIQARYASPIPAVKIEPFRPPAEPQLESCVTYEAKPQAVARPAESAAGDAGPKERRKRKRPRAPPASAKNAEEAESQRMNHIAVERNRRRLMNSHLSTLRSMMPPSFAQRGDQASIVAGAIDFVKELEHHLHSLQAKKRVRACSGPSAAATAATSSPTASSSSCTNDDLAPPPITDFFISPQYTGYTHNRHGEGVDVEATVVQGHVNLKVAGRRKRGQLVRGIAAMEEIGLAVLHLNIASLDDCSVLYSLNLKVEEECKLGSADEIATAVHQIFSYIIACC